MANPITITGKLGPNISVTSLVLDDVKNIEIQVDTGIFRVIYGSPRKIVDFDSSSITAITFLVSPGINISIVS